MSIGVIVIGYNRPKKLRALLESLEKYSEWFQEILVCLDYHSEEMQHWHERELHRFLINNEKYTFRFHLMNQGLKDNLFTATNYLKYSHEFLMFLEDDLVIRPNFNLYVESALDKLAKNEVTSVSLYSYPDVFSIRNSDFTMVGADCWGFIITGAKWYEFIMYTDYKRLSWLKKVRFNFYGTYDFYSLYLGALGGKNWAALFYYWAFVHGERVLYPKESLVENTGLDGSGTNCISSNSFTSGALYYISIPNTWSNILGYLSFIIFFVYEKINRRYQAL